MCKRAVGYGVSKILSRNLSPGRFVEIVVKTAVEPCVGCHSQCLLAREDINRDGGDARGGVGGGDE